MNLFEEVKNWLSNSPVVILIWVSCLLMFLIGLEHFREDIYSTFAGIQLIEKLYNIRPATWKESYYTMALSFSVGQIVLLYIYLVNTDRNRKALLGYFALLVADTVTDVYYRSNGFQFPHMALGVILGNVFFSFSITVVFYTLFSEMFLTMGFTMTLQLFSAALRQIAILKINLKTRLEKISVPQNYRPNRREPDLLSEEAYAGSPITLASRHHPNTKPYRFNK